MTPDIVALIKRLIKTHVPNVQHAIARGGTNPETQSLEQNYPGGPQMKARPVAHPYGFVSRAPDGMLAVTGRVGEHPGATMTLLHRDSARADMDLEYGESAVYSKNQHGVWARVDQTQLGSSSADNPVVLGTELLELLEQILDLLIAGQTVLTTTPGNPTAPNPAVAAQLTELKAKYLTTDTTNIVSQTVYTTRSGGSS